MTDFLATFGKVWDGRDAREHLSISERRALLALAELPVHHASSRWSDLSGPLREALVQAAIRMTSLGAAIASMVLREAG